MKKVQQFMHDHGQWVYLALAVFSCSLGMYFLISA